MNDMVEDICKPAEHTEGDDGLEPYSIDLIETLLPPAMDLLPREWLQPESEDEVKGENVFFNNVEPRKIQPTRKKRKKKPKPKSGPARPLSTYNYFFREHRMKLIKEHGGDAPFATLGDKVWRTWNSLTEEERQVWADKAKEDTERFRKEMKQLKESNKKESCSLNPRKQVESSSDLSSDSPPSHLTLETTRLSHNNPHEQPNEGCKEPIVGSFNEQSESLITNMVRDCGAVEIDERNLPPKFNLPPQYPSSGSQVMWPDPSGMLKSHTLRWKIYSMKASQVQQFLDQIQKPR